MKGVRSVLVKVQAPCGEGAQHTALGSRAHSSESSKANTKLPKQGWEGQWLSEQQQVSKRPALPAGEVTGSAAMVTHFNKHLLWKPCKTQHVAHGRSFPGWVQPMSSTAKAFTHTHSQCLLLSADSLNCEVKLLLLQQPEGSESEATEAVELQEQVILQETSWSCP